jgi:Ca2+-binding EF-hand superfamily protein
VELLVNNSLPPTVTARSTFEGFNEFSGLWKYIKDWQGIFKHFDKDRSGSIDGDEFRQAMTTFG